MVQFVRHILNNIRIVTNNRRRMFTVNTMSLHHNLQMATIIHAAGHRLAFCAPYYPVDGPMKYVFNTILLQQVLVVRITANAQITRVIVCHLTALCGTASALLYHLLKTVRIRSHVLHHRIPKVMCTWITRLPL